MKLLFVCTGNVCRSLMAERLALKLAAERGRTIEARSCGVAAEIYFRPPSEVWAALAEDGIMPSVHRPQLVGAALLSWADEVLAMTTAHRDGLRDAFPLYKRKIALLRERAGLAGNVPDPIGRPLKDFRICRNQIKEALERIL